MVAGYDTQLGTVRIRRCLTVAFEFAQELICFVQIIAWIVHKVPGRNYEIGLKRLGSGLEAGRQIIVVISKMEIGYVENAHRYILILLAPKVVSRPYVKATGPTCDVGPKDTQVSNPPEIPKGLIEPRDKGLNPSRVCLPWQAEAEASRLCAGVNVYQYVLSIRVHVFRSLQASTSYRPSVVARVASCIWLISEGTSFSLADPQYPSILTKIHYYSLKHRNPISSERFDVSSNATIRLEQDRLNVILEAPDEHRPKRSHTA